MHTAVLTRDAVPPRRLEQTVSFPRRSQCHTNRRLKLQLLKGGGFRRPLFCVLLQELVVAECGKQIHKAETAATSRKQSDHEQATATATAEWHCVPTVFASFIFSVTFGAFSLANADINLKAEKVEMYSTNNSPQN